MFRLSEDPNWAVLFQIFCREGTKYGRNAELYNRLPGLN